MVGCAHPTKLLKPLCHPSARLEAGINYRFHNHCEKMGGVDEVPIQVCSYYLRSREGVHVSRQERFEVAPTSVNIVEQDEGERTHHLEGLADLRAQDFVLGDQVC